MSTGCSSYSPSNATTSARRASSLCSRAILLSTLSRAVVQHGPSREEFARRNALGDKPLIALLAGSRRSEIRDNLADMARLAAEFPDYRFVVAGVDWIDRAAYEKYLSGTGIGFVCGQTYELLSR